jgi:hypothetical protein
MNCFMVTYDHQIAMLLAVKGYKPFCKVREDKGTMAIERTLIPSRKIQKVQNPYFS